MSFKKQVFLPLISLFLLGACMAKSKNNPQYNRQWMLVQFQNFDKEFLMKNQAELNLTQTPGKGESFSAFMGCNRMMVSGELKGDHKVKLEVTGVTMAYCEGNMALEEKFITELPKMKNYTIEGHFLTLTDDQGNEMKFVAADWD